jgi:hypothetical protein
MQGQPFAMPVSAGQSLKLERAKEHVDATRAVVAAWLESGTYGIEKTVDASAGRTEVRVRIREAPPARLALIVGDAVHNMRAALDHAVFDAAYQQSGGRLSPRDEENLMFPLIWAGTKEDFAKAARWRLPHIPRLVQDVIEEEQPFTWNTTEHPGGYRYHWLWRVHELDRIDKHRRLAITTAAVRHPFVTNPAGVEPKPKFFHAGGPVSDGRLLLSYLGAGPRRGLLLRPRGRRYGRQRRRRHGARDAGVAATARRMGGLADRGCVGSGKPMSPPLASGSAPPLPHGAPAASRP